MLKSKNESRMSSVKLMTLFLIVFVFFPVMYASGQTKIGDKTAPFFKIFSSGTYHMKAKMTTAGVASDMEMYAKGDLLSMVTSMQGQAMRTVVKDKKAYVIMDSLKMIMISAAGNESQSVDPNKMKYTGSGTAVFAGKSLPYDEYLNTDGSKGQFFVDGNKLAGIRTIMAKQGTVEMIVLELDQKIPNGVFDVPTQGYQVQDMSGLGR